jgi:hypothetical protein
VSVRPRSDQPKSAASVCQAECKNLMSDQPKSAASECQAESDQPKSAASVRPSAWENRAYVSLSS